MRARFALLLVLVLAGVAAHHFGLFELLGDTDRIRTLLTESGIWGPLVYVAVFSLFEPAGVPGILFIVPASLIWPLWLAVLLSWAGSIGAGVVGFGFARSLGRDWVQARLPDRLRGYDQRLAERGLTTVIVVRLLFFLAPPAHWVLGLSRVRFATFVAGTAIGFAPGIALITVVGKGAVVWLEGRSSGVWLAAGALLVGALVLARRLRARGRLRAAARAPRTEP